MKIDNRSNAITAVKEVLNEKIEAGLLTIEVAETLYDDLADLLLEAHLEGLDQGRGRHTDDQLLKRREFVLNEMKRDTSGGGAV